MEGRTEVVVLQGAGQLDMDRWQKVVGLDAMLQTM